MSWENLSYNIYADNKDTDQPVHLHSLVHAFVVSYLNRLIEPAHEIMVLIT